MEPMDIDKVTVVPDTPDKSAKQDIVRPSGLKNQNWTRSSFSNGVQFNPPRGIIRSGRSGNHACSLPLHGGDSSSNRSLLVRKERMDQVVSREDKNSDNLRCMQNKKPFVNSQSSNSPVSPGVDPAGFSREKFFQSNGGATLTGDFKKGSVLEDARSSCRRENDPHMLQNVGRERTVSNVVIVDSSPDSVDRQDTINLHKPSRQKRLVRNGCISPMNIAKGKQPVENNKSGSRGMEESDYADTGLRDHIPIQNTGVYHSCSSKGKEVLVNNSDGSNKLFETRTSASINEKNNRYSTNRDSVLCSSRADGWRTTHTRSSQQNFLTPLSYEVHHIAIDDDSPHFVGQASGNKSSTKDNEFDASTGHLGVKDSISNTRPASQIGGQLRAQFSKTNGRSHKAHNTLSKRQKQGFSLKTPAECSRSTADDSEIVDISSPTNETRSQLTHNLVPNAANNIMPVINIDEATPERQHISPHSTGCSSNDDARTTQVDLDERLARELQEQFYNEDFTVGTNEIDAHIALSLQQQQESRHTVSRERRPVSNARGSSSGQSSSRFPLDLVLGGTHARAATLSRVTRTRNSFTGRPRTLSSLRGRNSNLLSSRHRTPVFPAGMDIGAVLTPF